MRFSCAHTFPSSSAPVQEIQHAYHTNALLVKILLSEAQAGGLELHVDTNQLENEFLLRQIAHSEDTALSRCSLVGGRPGDYVVSL